jgi:phosphatidylserine/phosphatidylglycerophosphate/cardiolipin synthase-like enzyme
MDLNPISHYNPIIASSNQNPRSATDNRQMDITINFIISRERYRRTFSEQKQDIITTAREIMQEKDWFHS